MQSQFIIKNRKVLNENSYAGKEPSKIYLEDESARICCDFSAVDTSLIVTGISVAILGCEDETGLFRVQDFCTTPLHVPSIQKSNLRRGCIAVVSGNLTDLSNCRFSLLLDYLEGLIDVCTRKCYSLIDQYFRQQQSISDESYLLATPLESHNI